MGWCDRSSCRAHPVPSSGQRRAKARAPLPRRRSATGLSEARLMQTKRLWCLFITSMLEKHFVLRLKLSMCRPDAHVRDIRRKWGGKDSKECIVSRKQMVWRAVRMRFPLKCMFASNYLTFVTCRCNVSEVKLHERQANSKNDISSMMFSLNFIQYFGDATEIYCSHIGSVSDFEIICFCPGIRQVQLFIRIIVIKIVIVDVYCLWSWCQKFLQSIVLYYFVCLGYKIIQKIGEGTFSEVLKTQSLKDGKFYACKTMKQTINRYVPCVWPRPLPVSFPLHPVVSCCVLTLETWTSSSTPPVVWSELSDGDSPCSLHLMSSRAWNELSNTLNLCNF